MAAIGIAMDLGTSGFRAQALALSNSEVLSTAMTARHPLPGANVMDHVHFALEMGVHTARSIVIAAINRVIAALGVDASLVVRLSVCGNPAQLSIFQGIEIRDLAYAGKNLLDNLKVIAPKRDAAVIKAEDFPRLALPPACEVIVPPAVRHEVGADALALIIQTGLEVKNETAMAIDYGTNAELALFHRGRIFTGSTAAGPAIEGQHIECGMLAAPGAIADLVPSPPNHRLVVLSGEMTPLEGALINLETEGFLDVRAGVEAAGITGTGTIAAIGEGIRAGLVRLPAIVTGDGRLHLGDEVYVSENDVIEAGKAFGAIRAGWITLCHEAGITPDEVKTVYLAGASGTYADPVKSQRLGLFPPQAEKAFRAGNTSLAMAVDLIVDPENLNAMTRMADKIRDTHCMFAASETFSGVFLLEFSHWTEGMPMSMYNEFLRKYGLPELRPIERAPEIPAGKVQDIAWHGPMGLSIVHDVGLVARYAPEGCIQCLSCLHECPEQAIGLTGDGDNSLSLDLSRCDGVACRRCERICPEEVFYLVDFFLQAISSEPERES